MAISDRDKWILDQDPRGQFAVTSEGEARKEAYKVMPPHYYGDTVRKFFFLGSLVLLLSFPVFVRFVPVSVFVSVLGALLFGLAAAWTSPAQKIIGGMNTLIASGATLIFEYYASIHPLYAFEDTYELMFRLINLFLAVNFFFAFYYGLKTLRGYFFKK